jgi:hypothetical protein
MLSATSIRSTTQVCGVIISCYLLGAFAAFLCMQHSNQSSSTLPSYSSLETALHSNLRSAQTNFNDMLSRMPELDWGTATEEELTQVLMEESVAAGALEEDLKEELEEGEAKQLALETIAAHQRLKELQEAAPEIIVPAADVAASGFVPSLGPDRAPLCDPISPEDVAVTLVTTTSEERMWTLAEHCERWPGDIAASVFTEKSREELTLAVAALKQGACAGHAEKGKVCARERSERKRS